MEAGEVNDDDQPILDAFKRLKPETQRAVLFRQMQLMEASNGAPTLEALIECAPVSLPVSRRRHGHGHVCSFVLSAAPRP